MRLLALLALFFSTMTVAQAKVLLLTSFAKHNEQKVVENAFIKHMRPARGQPDMVIDIRHRATQWELYEAIRKTDYEGVFWVSHGLAGDTVMGSRVVSKLLDYRGDNIAPVFSLASPKLNFLAVIGCGSANILKETGVDASVLTRSYVSSDSRANAAKEIEKSVKAFRALKPRDESTVTERRANFGTLTVRRTMPITSYANLRTLRVLVGEKVVGVMPPAIVGTTQESDFKFSPENGMDVKVETGENSVDVNQLGIMGDIEVFSRDVVGRWELFTEDNGKPLGVNHRLFFYEL